MQEELEEARNLVGANREGTAAMARQIEVLIEDQNLKRNDLESLRRQLDTSIDLVRDAQSRLRSATERQNLLPPPVPMTSTPLTRPTATPTSGVTTQLLPDPLGAMYAGSNERSGDRDLGTPGTTRATKRIDLYDRRDLGNPGMMTTSI